RNSTIDLSVGHVDCDSSGATGTTPNLVADQTAEIGLPGCGRDPTVNHEGGAGHVGRIVGGQESDHRRHFLRLADTSHGHELVIFLQRSRCRQERLQQRRVDRSRAHAVDPDVVAGVIDGDRPCEVDHATLGGVVRQQPVVAEKAGDGGGVDDGAAAGPAQVRDGVLATVEDGGQIDVDDVFPDLDVEFGRFTVGADTGVVEDDVHGTAAVGGML